jgi:hypothetical protein
MEEATEQTAEVVRVLRNLNEQIMQAQKLMGEL